MPRRIGLNSGGGFGSTETADEGPPEDPSVATRYEPGSSDYVTIDASNPTVPDNYTGVAVIITPGGEPLAVYYEGGVQKESRLTPEQKSQVQAAKRTADARKAAGQDIATGRTAEGGYREEERAAYEGALGEYGFDAPSAESLEVGDSAWEGVAADPEAIAAQREALGRLRGLYDEGGLDAIDRARIQQARGQAAQMERGQREALMRQAEMRGGGGGGASLAGQLAAQQGSMTRLSQQQQGIEALAQQRRMQALQDAAGLGSTMRGQSFNEQGARATALDAIQRFNSEARSRGFGHQMDRAGARSGMQEREATRRFGEMEASRQRALQRYGIQKGAPGEDYSWVSPVLGTVGALAGSLAGPGGAAAGGAIGAAGGAAVKKYAE